MPQPLKLACLEPVLHNKRSHRNEKPTHHNEEQPLLTAATRGSPHTATKKGEREEGRKGGREEGRKGGRKGGREEGKEKKNG